MGKIILFSPIGGTDPMSLNNCHDGSLIHICRVYKPDVVYLYMSKEILENHSKDNRYIYCLDKLSESINHKMEYHIIERPELTDVQKFDVIYEDMQEIVNKLTSEMNDDDRLLLNVSSGTPAMKSSLLVMNVLGEYRFTAVQVATPTKKMNEHSHKDYSDLLELLWEENEDNKEEFVNRCSEVDCPALLAMKINEIIKKHIQGYDYFGALNTVSTVTEKDSRIEFMLKLAYARSVLDFKTVDEIERKLGVNITPMKSGDVRKYYEYALILLIKQKKEMYADFLRAITPLIVDLYELIIKNRCNIDIRNYTYNNSSTNGEQWSRSKLESDSKGIELKEILEREYTNFSYGYVSSDNLTRIIIQKSTDSEMNSLVEDLRSVESKIRNLAAHQIISIDDDRIKNETGFSSLQIIKKIKRAFFYAGINVTEEKWNSYDEMNKMIIDTIDGKK